MVNCTDKQTNIQIDKQTDKHVDNGQARNLTDILNLYLKIPFYTEINIRFNENINFFRPYENILKLNRTFKSE